MYLRVERHLSNLAHLRAGWAPWVVAGRCWGRARESVTDALSFRERRAARRRSLATWADKRTFADLGLDAGVPMGHVFDASHNLGHGGRL